MRQGIIRKAIWIFLLAIFALLCVSPVATTAQSDEVPQHVVIAVVGEARLNRSTWGINTWDTLTIGTLLGPGDLIEPKQPAQIFVLCADLKKVDIVQEYTSSPCTEYDDPQLLASTAPAEQGSGGRGSGEEIPYLISPRFGTNLLSDHPTFRWAPISGAGDYNLEILQGTTSIHLWTNLKSTVLAYPADAAPLPPGTYTALVTANKYTGSSVSTVNNATDKNTFVVLSGQEDFIQSLKQNEQTVNSILFPDATPQQIRQYLLSLNYSEPRYQLYAEAIELLNQLVGWDPAVDATLPSTFQPITTVEGSPTPYMQLGELYERLQLYNEALKAYTIALRIGQSNNIREVQAEAYAHMGYVVSELKDQYCFYDAAQTVYEEMGDIEGINLFAEPFQQLQKRFTIPPDCAPIIQALG